MKYDINPVKSLLLLILPQDILNKQLTPIIPTYLTYQCNL